MEDLLNEGRIAGIDYWGIYDWTVAEIYDYIAIYRERIRREGQRRALELFEHAMLIGKIFAGKDDGPVMVTDAFPQYYTEEEKNDALRAYYTNKFLTSMRRQANG